MPEPFPTIDLWVFEPDLDLPPFPPAMGGDSATAVREGRREREKQLLKAVLGERLNSDPKGLKIEIAAGGKPFVNGCKFSISHSGAWLIVAVSDREIGVDIETRKALKDPMALATRFFSPADADYLKSAREDLREKFFLRQWVAKEAALKCAGTGISEHLHRAECGYEQSAITTVGCAADRFAIHEFMLPDETPGAVAWHDDGTLVGIRRRQSSEIRVS